MPKTPKDGEQAPKFAPDLFIVPASIMLDPELQPLDSKVYGIIYWLERLKDGRCWASNETIANIVGASASAVSHSIGRLFAKHYVIVTLNEKNQRTSIVCTQVFGSHYNPSSNEQGGVAQTSYIDKNIKKNSSAKYDDETLKQIKSIHKKYVQLFKINGDIWRTASLDERRSLLLGALNRYKLTDSRKALIHTRLKDAGYETVMRAVVKADRSPWNHGENDSNWKMDLYVYLLRNYEMVERWANQDEGDQ